MLLKSGGAITGQCSGTVQQLISHTTEKALTR